MIEGVVETRGGGDINGGGVIEGEVATGGGGRGGEGEVGLAIAD